MASQAETESPLQQSTTPERIPFPPGSEQAQAADALVRYLLEGESEYGYKHGIRYVSEPKIRDFALRAGYTEFALTLGWLGGSDLEASERFPEEPEHRFAVHVYGANRYGLPRGRYDGVEVTRWVVDTQEPDLPVVPGDPLRDHVLGELERMDAMKKALRAAGKEWFSLGSWRFHIDGSMDFWLNPYDQQQVNFGWFTLPELGTWLSGDPTSPILKNPTVETNTAADTRQTYEDYYAGELATLATKTLIDAERDMATRLMTIALMRCPFPRLVEQYQTYGLFQ